MNRKMTCIQCPAGCFLDVEVENNKVIKVQGNKCVKGEEYAKDEIENPVRLLTTTVKASGLSVKMIPVKTDTGVPREKLFDAMQEISKLCITGPVMAGDIISDNLVGLNVKVVSTRTVSK